MVVAVAWAAGRSLEMANGAAAGVGAEAGRVRATERLHWALLDSDMTARLWRRGDGVRGPGLLGVEHAQGAGDVVGA